MSLKIDVYSDVICPWCYLGKKRLEIALNKLGNPLVDLRYRPFELNSSIPEEGVDHKKYLASKYGDRAIQLSHERLMTLGKEVGIDYHFEKIRRIPNTFKAHRLLWLAEKEGLQTQVKESLMKGYFVEGRDLSSREVLRELAVRAGLDSSMVTELFKDHNGEDEVHAAEAKAYDLGISGVPFFIFNDETAIEGAQPLETFERALHEQLSK